MTDTKELYMVFLTNNQLHSCLHRVTRTAEHTVKTIILLNPLNFIKYMKGYST